MPLKVPLRMQNSPNTNPMGELTASPSSRTTCKTARTPTRRAGARLAVLAGRHAKQPEHQPDGRGSPSRARLRLQNCPSPGPNHRTSHDRAPSGRLNQPRAIPGKRRPTSGQATGHRGRQQSNGNGALEQATGHRGRQFAYPNRRFPTPLPVSCPNTAHRTRKGCTEHPAPP